MNLWRKWRFRLARRRMDRMSQPMVDAKFRRIVGRWRYENRRDCCDADQFDTDVEGGTK